MPRLLQGLHMTVTTLQRAMGTFDFSLSPQVLRASSFGPRLGSVSILREDDGPPLELKTPGLIATTSRGIVPHLSRDHVNLTESIRWVQLPFESL